MIESWEWQRDLNYLSHKSASKWRRRSLKLTPLEGWMWTGKKWNKNGPSPPLNFNLFMLQDNWMNELLSSVIQRRRCFQQVWRKYKLTVASIGQLIDLLIGIKLTCYYFDNASVVIFEEKMPDFIRFQLLKWEDLKTSWSWLAVFFKHFIDKTISRTNNH